jgi:hypothetical protein
MLRAEGLRLEGLSRLIVELLLGEVLASPGDDINRRHWQSRRTVRVGV